MKAQFKDGTIKSCSAPTEQKVFKNKKDELGNTVTVASGWIMIFNLSGGMTSDEADRILTEDNISKLVFLTENESGEDVELFELSGYTKISSTTIRHAEDDSASYTEIQLTKDL